VSATTLVGYAAVFGVSSGIVADDGDRRYRLIIDRHALDGFIDRGLGCPLMLGHTPTFHSWGVQPSVGTVREYRADDFGVLVRAEVDTTITRPSPFHAASTVSMAESVLAAVRSGQLWAMSWQVGIITSDPPDIPTPRTPLTVPTVQVLEAGIGEVSLTGRPGFADARILAVGDEAEWLWDYPDLAGVALAAAGR
jgi:hypothetical protein